jgi:hypothetical protein
MNLLNDPNQAVPQAIKAYLKQLGVVLIEYPSGDGAPEKPLVGKAPETTADAVALVEKVLTLTGHSYASKVKIPAFKSRNDDFKLTVTADFYLKARGRERVIDLSGLDPEIVALLRERGILVLALAKEKNSLSVASKTLKFLGWKHKMGPHTLSSGLYRNNNVELTLSGVTFFTEQGDSVFMTPLALPPEVALFLHQKGYRVVTLAPLFPGGGARAAWERSEKTNAKF